MNRVGELIELARIDPSIDSRAVSFENPTGSRGTGGFTAGGRKGSPSRRLAPGERIVVADLRGPGVLRHLWMTFLPAPPEMMRSLMIEVFYEDAAQPSISVPCLDFFGLPHGRPVAYHSALTSVNEGRGFNTYIPMPFRQAVRVELANLGLHEQLVYYQIDYTLHPDLGSDIGVLHASFRRENPTSMQRDFTIAEGFTGPGRFLGCNIGIRTLDPQGWYGEGEIKIYRDGDTDYPTICGTGFEDYIGSAWGLGPHATPYGGAPLIVSPPQSGEPAQREAPHFVGAYRWHLFDPITFERDLRVTVQQIGAVGFAEGEEDAYREYARSHRVAGAGWIEDVAPGRLAWGLVERVDDYCATAFVYCLEPQGVRKVDLATATADIGRREYEVPSPLERMGASTIAQESDHE